MPREEGTSSFSSYLLNEFAATYTRKVHSNKRKSVHATIMKLSKLHVKARMQEKHFFDET